MQSLTQKIEEQYKKKKITDVRSGDTVKVSQKIKEGSKERVQIFEGLVIRTKRRGSSTNSITVRRIASGVGVEKSFMLHSPLIERVEVMKRSDVNRNYLTYMRNRSGKSARLESVDFDRAAVNEAQDEKDPEPVKEEAPIKEEQPVEEAAETKPAKASEDKEAKA